MFALTDTFIDQRILKITEVDIFSRQQFIKRQQFLVQVELEPPDITQQRHRWRGFCLEGGCHFLGGFLVAALKLIVEDNIFLTFVKTLDQFGLRFTIDPALAAPQGNCHRFTGRGIGAGFGFCSGRFSFGCGAAGGLLNSDRGTGA
jgi:hypothetical protein